MKPSIGRIVHFYPYNDGQKVIGQKPVSGPCAAIVTRVHSDRVIDLAVFDAPPIDGILPSQCELYRSVEFYEDPVTYSWQWPPRI